MAAMAAMSAMAAKAEAMFQIVADAAAAVVAAAAAVHRSLQRSVRADGRPRAEQEQAGMHSGSSDRSSSVIELHACWCSAQRLRCCRHRRSHCLRRRSQLRQRQM